MTPRRSLRPFAPALALALLLPVAPAVAQEPAVGEPAAAGEGSGRPFDGYLATAALCGLALFLVAKSARRG